MKIKRKFGPGRFLYQQKIIKKALSSGGAQVRKDLEQLHPGIPPEELAAEYYAGKINKFLLICMVGLLLGGGLRMKAAGERKLSEMGIVRGEYGEVSRELELVARWEDGKEQNISVTVEPRELEKKEVEALCERLLEGLPELIRQGNPSLEKVTEELLLEDAYEGYPFRLEWDSDRPDVISDSGQIYRVKEKTEVLLTAEIFWGDLKWQESVPVTVIPPLLTEEEAERIELEELLATSEADARLEKNWKLPELFRGEKIHWEQKKQDKSLLFAAGSLAVAAVVFWLEDKDLHKELGKKRAVMKRAYPGLVQKITLYLGAGLTIRGTFQRLAGEEEKEAVYEEIRHTWRELQAGMSEALAYERFGRRTGVQEYMRLCTLLAQNLRKGNGTLLRQLEEEVSRAETDRLQSCRKLAEEASTKLLVPMVLFLTVVMIVIMLPAFSSMGGS